MTRRVLGSIVMLAVVAIGSVHAEELGSPTLRTSGFFDAWSLLGAPGRIGWLPGVTDGAAPPNAFAGLAVGGVRMIEDTRAPDRPWPGLVGVRTPIVWVDSLSTVLGGAGGWQGFEAAMFEAAAVPLGGTPRAQPDDHAVGMVSFIRGTSAEEQTSLSVARLDSLLPIRLEALSIKRGAIGSMEKSGRHLWGGTVGAQFGAHRFDASFSQRGAAGALASGEDESGTALSGGGSWIWTRARDRFGVEVARGYHHLESAGNTLTPSRRDADELAADADWSMPHATGEHAVRVSFRSAQVDRVTQGSPDVHTSDDAVWLAVREQRIVAGGRLVASLGGGRSRATDATGWAPSLSWTRRLSGFEVRGVGERIVTPVWSDLAPGTDPFLQSTWVGGVDLGRHGPGWSGTLGVRGGITDDRALVARDPLTELWLRRGIARDPGSYPFQMATAALASGGSHFSGGAEGFALVHHDSDAQPDVDPGFGGRIFVQTGFRVFADELAVTMRLDGIGVGERESEAGRDLAPFGMLDAVVNATLADAVVTFSVRNLTDLVVPEVWIDPRTGIEARSPGREMHFAITWRLFN